MRILGLSLVASLSFTAGCLSGGSAPSSEQTALDGARAKFPSPDYYSFNSTRGCECLDDVSRPMWIEVSAGEVNAAFYLPNFTPEVASTIQDHLLTIEGGFDLIQLAIDEQAESIDVVYDAELGYPTRIAIDWESQIADEEDFLQFADFREEFLSDPTGGD